MIVDNKQAHHAALYVYSYIAIYYTVESSKYVSLFCVLKQKWGRAYTSLRVGGVGGVFARKN